MKILIHLDHSSAKSYLLLLDREMSVQDIRVLVNDGFEKAVSFLMESSQCGIELHGINRFNAEKTADVIVGPGYVKESL